MTEQGEQFLKILFPLTFVAYLIFEWWGLVFGLVLLIGYLVSNKIL